MTMMVKVCAANIAIELAIKQSGTKFIGYKGLDRQNEILCPIPYGLAQSKTWKTEELATVEHQN